MTQFTALLHEISIYCPHRADEFLQHVTEIYEFANTNPICYFFFGAFRQLHDYLDKGNRFIKQAVFVCLFFHYTFIWGTWLLRMVTFDFINEDDKIVAEKRVIVGWNLLHSVEDALSDSTIPPEKKKTRASSPARGKKNSRAPSHLPTLSTGTSPRTLAQDIREFRLDVQAGLVKLTLITECTFMIDEAVSEQTYVDNFVSAAQRRLPPDDYSDDREDFMVIFDYSECGATHQWYHVFKNLSKGVLQAYYRMCGQLFIIGLTAFFLMPEKQCALPSVLVPYFSLLNAFQEWLYKFWAANIGVFILLNGYNIFIAKYHRYFPTHKAEGLAATVRGVIPGIHVAQSASRERQQQEQGMVIRSLLNKVSEKLSGSNWVSHCKQRVRPVPPEFWEQSKMHPGRYLMVATCEKDPSVMSICSRIWLIHPYDLFLLRNISLLDINLVKVDYEGQRTAREVDLNKYPYVGHKLRLQHLRQ